MKQIVNVTDANESSVVFTLNLTNRSTGEWPNPYIVVNSGGFELVLGHGGEAIRKVAKQREEVERMLSKHKVRVERWPSG